MLTARQVKLRLPQKSYSWPFMIITSLFFLNNVILIALGVALIYFTIELKSRLVADLILLKSLLHVNVTFLLIVSVLVIVFCSLGLLSIWTSSHVGALTNAGLLLALLCLSNTCMLDMPGIDVRSVDLYHIFVEKIKNNLSNIVAMDKLQQKYSCCGVHNYTDWLDVIKIIPGSCCNSLTTCNINDPKLYTDGCSDKIIPIINKLERMFRIVYSTFNITGMITIFMAFAAYTLYRNIHRHSKQIFSATMTLPRAQNQRKSNTSQVSFH